MDFQYFEYPAISRHIPPYPALSRTHRLAGFGRIWRESAASSLGGGLIIRV